MHLHIPKSLGIFENSHENTNMYRSETSKSLWPYCALDAWPPNETYCLTRASSSFMQIWFYLSSAPIGCLVKEPNVLELSCQEHILWVVTLNTLKNTDTSFACRLFLVRKLGYHQYLMMINFSCNFWILMWMWRLYFLINERHIGMLNFFIWNELSSF